MFENKCPQDRRSHDTEDRRLHLPPCEDLNNTKGIIEELKMNINDTRNVMHLMQEDIHETKEAVLAMKEILDAWKNAKGFVNTIIFIGDVVKWIAAVGAIIGAWWYYFRK